MNFDQQGWRCLWQTIFGLVFSESVMTQYQKRLLPRNLRACLKCFQDSMSFRMKFFRGKICHHNHSRTRVFFFHRHLVILDGCGTNGDFKAWFQGVKCMKWIFLCSTCDTKIIQNLVGNIHLHVSPTQTLYTMG